MLQTLLLTSSLQSLTETRDSRLSRRMSAIRVVQTQCLRSGIRSVSLVRTPVALCRAPFISNTCAFSARTIRMTSSSANARVNSLVSHLGQHTGKLLQGQVAIITGSGQGIGKAAALLFAAHGANVVVSDIDAAKAQSTVDEIEKSDGGKALAFAGDVMKEKFGEEVVKATIEKFGKINHLILNAGFTNDKMIHTMDDATFQMMLDCHTVAPFRVLRAAAPHFRVKDPERRENRSIVYVSSTSGTHGNVGQLNYAAAKAGVVGMNKTTAKEWGPFGVRSNCVAFGWIQTRLTAAKEEGASIEVNGKKVALGIPGRGKKDTANDVNATIDIPLRRPGEAAEAASAILFLASPLASYVSGQTLEVTGGRGI
ncbi:NAD(P)-binding protein [Ceraceosorus guamensis]|uniref:NAD(P)-binding protein n=1 Tax=Ceraceosorus guamensis TaxID=1522189 RepID=A0A316VXS6_9BASI|nr:NAD(P)-binding protein [Ceraceosorus guamensis]PWN41708.1 NAD(P)-binding protein [Ceraceosorus guamensis]